MLRQIRNHSSNPHHIEPTIISIGLLWRLPFYESTSSESSLRNPSQPWRTVSSMINSLVSSYISWCIIRLLIHQQAPVCIALGLSEIRAVIDGEGHQIKKERFKISAMSNPEGDGRRNEEDAVGNGGGEGVRARGRRWPSLDAEELWIVCVNINPVISPIHKANLVFLQHQICFSKVFFGSTTMVFQHFY